MRGVGEESLRRKKEWKGEGFFLWNRLVGDTVSKPACTVAIICFAHGKRGDMVMGRCSYTVV